MAPDAVSALSDLYETLTPREMVRETLSRFTRIAVSFSGAEDVVLVDLAVKARRDVQIFTLDTGRLHPETYAFIEKVNAHYGIQVEVLFPDATAVESLVREKGLFSFYRDNHGECCGIRKIAPLKRKLAGLDAWLTGQRRDQSPTRKTVALVENDPLAENGRSLIKINPLAKWTSAEVWSYIRAMELPYNSLHERGFISIGCEPCTRPVLPGQHEREGRWWWEESTARECGLHVGNISKKE